MKKADPNLNKRIEAYVDGLTKAFQDDPKSLSEMERKLTRRAEDNRAVANRCETEIDRLNKRITQDQATIKSLELQKQAALGKASGLFESLAMEKFDLDAEGPSVERPADKKKEPEQAESAA